MKKKKQTAAERQREQARERNRQRMRLWREANPELARKLQREQKRRLYAKQKRGPEYVRPEDLEVIDHEGIKALAEKLRRPAHTLIALAPQNDPFSIRPQRLAAAKWFVKIWERFGFKAGVHLRRIHYVLVSQKQKPLNQYGMPYQNTLKDWSDLTDASRDARYLGLVPSSHFIDRRNNDPIINLTRVSESADLWVVDESPKIEASSPAMPDLPELYLKRPTIQQRYHIEIWCEKTTMNDVLEPLAERYGCNLITGSGELSMTACENLVERARASGLPVRVLYLSDFDPSGMSMPVAVARKIEFRLRHDQLDLDIQVRPIALTFEQCVRFELPRTPLKETDPRANRFEERFGEGATELDALEALHPGELHRIIEAEIKRYYDDTLDRRIRQTASRIERSISTLNRDAHDLHREAISELESEWDEIISDYETAIEAWTDKAETTWDAIAEALEENKPDVSDVEWPEPAEGNEDPDPLYKSSRDYLTQIDRYKKHQDKLTTRKKNGGAS